jgi:chromosomal replication initiation ATPase DnaA
MRKHNLLFRAGYCTLLVIVAWIATGFICQLFIQEKMMVFVVGTISQQIVFGMGVLLFLDPVESQKPLLTEKKNKIWAYVIKHYGTNREDLLGLQRVSVLVDARGVIAYTMRKFLAMTYKQIGIELNRDHTSIISLIGRMQDRIDTKDDQIEKQIKEVEKLLNQ